MNPTSPLNQKIKTTTPNFIKFLSSLECYPVDFDVLIDFVFTGFKENFPGVVMSHDLRCCTGLI